MNEGLLKGVAAVSIFVAVCAGGAAWYAKSEGQRRIDMQHATAQGCQTQLSACVDQRDSKEKAWAEASASLSSSRAELDELRADRAEQERRLAAFKGLTEKFQKMIDAGKLQIVLRHGRMVVKLASSVLFASGSAELSKEGKDALREVASILRSVHDRRFMVAGHTDNVPVGQPSPFKNNLDLSTERALTVAQQLVASGMNPARLVAAGYSEHEPVRENSSEAGRQENRRIEIVLMPNVTELPGMPGADAGAPEAGAAAKPEPSAKPADAGAKP